jgi:CHAT domain
MGVDYQDLIAIFNEWSYLNYSKRDELDWLAIDGKSIRSTVVNSQNSQQNYMIVVSMFSQTTSEVVRLGVFESKKDSEVHKVQEMVKDGVVGLSRSLVTAGAQSVVVSLWKVPDDATAMLMTQFYENLQQGLDKATALRDSMLETRATYPDPVD